MAIKNTEVKEYTIASKEICSVLRSPEFVQCMRADFVEEAILSDAIEFRFRRMTDWTRYGRNYFIKVKSDGKNGSVVSVTTQSRKLTVLIDTQWRKEVAAAFGFIDMLLKR